ncbi:MAG: spheroidene monooxygenase [Ferruginibacter sp.]
MQVSLTIIRYPKIFIPFAFLAMAIHRLPLWLNKKISFYKLMGCGKNGTFDKRPDLQQWAILSVYDEPVRADKNLLKTLYGSFISGWLHFFNCEAFTILLSPIEGHGLWDGRKVFGELDNGNRESAIGNELIAVLTRATIRLNKLKYFWQHVAPVAQKMNVAKGFITSFGIGELPWIKQATFSIWETAADMKAFAYGVKEHVEVIKKTREQKWYSEEMFVRFRIIGSKGTLKGINPLNMYDV